MFSPKQVVYRNAAYIAIFNNNRQQALGNISILCAYGAKIYLRNDTSMWEYYINNVRVTVWNIKEIFSSDYKNFINYPSQLQEKNMKRCKDYLLDTERVRREWSLMLNNMLSSNTHVR